MLRRVVVGAVALALAGAFGWGLMSALGRFLRTPAPTELADVETPAPTPTDPPISPGPG